MTTSRPLLPCPIVDIFICTDFEFCIHPLESIKTDQVVIASLPDRVPKLVASRINFYWPHGLFSYSFWEKCWKVSLKVLVFLTWIFYTCNFLSTVVTIYFLIPVWIKISSLHLLLIEFVTKSLNKFCAVLSTVIERGAAQRWLHSSWHVNIYNSRRCFI